MHCVYTTVIYMYYDIKIENRIKNISGNIFQSETQKYISIQRHAMCFLVVKYNHDIYI